MERSRKVKLTDDRVITIRRLNMGERMDVEEASTVGNDINDRNFMANLVAFCSDPKVEASEFFKLDQNDGFALYWTALDINDTIVNKKDFLLQSKAEVKTKGLTESLTAMSNTSGITSPPGSLGTNTGDNPPS